MAVEVREGAKVTAYGLYIDGDYRVPSGAQTLPVVNPATGETWATIVDASAEDVDTAVRAAQ
ncbi:MAG: aldehyde dehydrogenase family protein, partial [Candidatus Eremiobacteraeota bacterium]|nr:aldehyde dehydrogenase family protein [Candidatus Eremiobacteraeota bacterium]